MDFKSLAEKYSEATKDMVVQFSKLNKDRMHMHNEYHSGALNTFFNMWHKHFPHINQSKNCESCRKAVSKFFHNMADYITSSREIPKVLEEVEASAEPKIVKKKKAKTNGKKK